MSGGDVEGHGLPPAADRALDALRASIDAIDERLVALLAERLRLAQEIGRAKVGTGLGFFDPARERRVLEKVRALAGADLPSDRIEAIYREIISASRTAQAGETVLVHGAFGSVAHEAAVLRFGTGARFDFTPSDRETFHRLDGGGCDYAVISLEGRSLEVSFDRLDLFLHSAAQVFAEVSVRPRLALLVPADDGSGQTAALPPPGASPTAEPAHGMTMDASAPFPVAHPATPMLPGGEVRGVPAGLAVFGVPSTLARASGFLAARSDLAVNVAATLPDALRVAAERGGAVLASPLVATLCGWREVASGIEDESAGRRRFFVLASRSAPPSGRDRTLLLLVLANRSGALHAVTEVFVECGINLSWMEPKSSHLGSWDHLFLFELDGHRDDPAVARTVERLAGRTEVLRVLGSYPREAEGRG